MVLEWLKPALARTGVCDVDLLGRFASARGRRSSWTLTTGGWIVEWFPFSKDHVSNVKLIVGNTEISITVKGKHTYNSATSKEFCNL